MNEVNMNLLQMMIPRMEFENYQKTVRELIRKLEDRVTLLEEKVTSYESRGTSNKDRGTRPGVQGTKQTGENK